MSRIEQAVNEKENTNDPGLRAEIPRVAGLAFASLVFAVGINLFLRPIQLYSGGFLGISQLIQTGLERVLGIDFGALNLSSILYYILNLPGMIWAFFVMRRRFVVKTLFAVTCSTVLMAVIPIPAAPLLEDKLAGCLVAGAMAGFGVGFMLRMGACDGGLDIISMILVQKHGNFSVGKIGLVVNCVIYAICLFVFDVPTAIYSMIYSLICSFMFDRVHTQNINVQVLIITKLQNIEPLEIDLMGKMNRGRTRWNAYGGYTGDEGTVLMAVISKYEVGRLRSIVREFDPHAFMMLQEGVHVDGYFLKKRT